MISDIVRLLIQHFTQGEASLSTYTAGFLVQSFTIGHQKTGQKYSWTFKVEKQRSNQVKSNFYKAIFREFPFHSVCFSFIIINICSPLCNGFSLYFMYKNNRINTKKQNKIY